MNRITMFFAGAAGLTAGVILFVWSGLYNVAATAPHFGATEWLFGKVRDRSIAARADTIRPPTDLGARLDREHAVRSFHDMCVICHSAPGREPSIVREGLNPKPPRFNEDRVQARGNAELFWIITHGIKMTGMPAFGPTHKDEEIWELVAFIRELSKMQPDEYDALLAEAGIEEKPSGHMHNDGQARGRRGHVPPSVGPMVRLQPSFWPSVAGPPWQNLNGRGAPRSSSIAGG